MNCESLSTCDEETVCIKKDRKWKKCIMKCYAMIETIFAAANLYVSGRYIFRLAILRKFWASFALRSSTILQSIVSATDY